LNPTTRRGNLSAALIAALRAGSSLRDRADSLQLVIVSPFAKEELDAATDSIRKLWPGKATLVRVGSSVAPLLRGEPRIEWPDSARPRFAVQRAVPDTVGGVMTGEAVVVAAFARRWSFPPDSLRGGEIVARWVDGEAAAIERADSAGCVRSVAVPVSAVGDLAIRNDFVRFVSALSGACISGTSLTTAAPDAIIRLEGKGGLAPREAFQPLSNAPSALAPWLFALAIAAAIAELFVRRRGSDAKTSEEIRPASREARAA
jgi:hypothetical protein